jgi:Cdc6-like AAA superfamily ATPase
METESSVSPSDAAALRTVLEYWAERAVVDEARDTSGIAKAVVLAAQEVGDTQQALDLLQVGAELVEQHGKAPDTDAYIETARERLQRGRVAMAIRSQTEHTQSSRKRSRPSRRAREALARSKEIQRTYERVAASHAAAPLSALKGIQDHLSDLSMWGSFDIMSRTKPGRRAILSTSQSRLVETSACRRCA